MAHELTQLAGIDPTLGLGRNNPSNSYPLLLESTEEQPALSGHLNLHPTKVGAICLQCGICCDGTLFSTVVLRRGDRPAFLRGHGLRIRRRATGTAPRLQQPCAALEGCRCRVYGDRPAHCREFECALLLEYRRRRLTRREVIRRIRRTRKLAARAAIILTQLGEGEAKTSLRTRFRRLCHSFDASSAPPASAALFHELSLVMHTLNLKLSDWFYP